MNRANELRELFRRSLRSKVVSSSGSNYSPMYRSNNGLGSGVLDNIHRVPGQYEREIQFGKDIRIYFYEWSDINKAPRCFYTLDAFTMFLHSSGIRMELYHKDIICNLGTVYVTCYRGTKDLNVRGSYKGLLDSMNSHDMKGMVSSVSPSVSKAPKVIFEAENRWPENDGTFFG